MQDSLPDLLEEIHTVINYYNHINFSMYPSTHGREISLSVLFSMKNPLANIISTDKAMMLWYLDLEASLHIVMIHIPKRYIIVIMIKVLNATNAQKP